MEFPIAFRGYARAAVDARLSRLEAQLKQAQQRAAQAEVERDRARAQLDAAAREALLRAEEAELALVAVHEAAAPPETTQPIPLDDELLDDEDDATTTRTTGATPSTRRRSRAPVAVAAVLALAAAAAVTVLLTRGEDPAPRTAAAAPSASPSPTALTGTTAPQAARVAPAPAPEPAQVPDGWRTVRAPNGLWSIALPPGWRTQGDGFVSASGLTTMSVRTGVLTGEPDLLQYEKAFAADHPGYKRLAARTGPFRGHRAGTWDYVYGAGATQQRGSDLGVIVGNRGYWLHVVSRASAWEFARPLVQGFRASFTPSP